MDPTRVQAREGGPEAKALGKNWTRHWDGLWWWAKPRVDAHNNLDEHGLRPHLAMKRTLSWESRANQGPDRTALLASVIQTGKMLRGQSNPFPFGPGAPAPK